MNILLASEPRKVANEVESPEESNVHMDFETEEIQGVGPVTGYWYENNTENTLPYRKGCENECA